jgi:hypothetical protein
MPAPRVASAAPPVVLDFWTSVYLAIDDHSSAILPFSMRTIAVKVTVTRLRDRLRDDVLERGLHIWESRSESSE